VHLRVQQRGQQPEVGVAVGGLEVPGDVTHDTAEEVGQAGKTSITVYGVEGPGWPLRQQWADPRRGEQILFAANAAETEPSLIGFSDHLIAAATTP
jgi:hypothetical protein